MDKKGIVIMVFTEELPAGVTIVVDGVTYIGVENKEIKK
jgi:hypothetical protein